MKARIEEGGNGFPDIGGRVLHSSGEVYMVIARGRIQTEQYKSNWMEAEVEGADWDDWAEDADLGCKIEIIEDDGLGACECGCGMAADTTIRLLPEQDRGTAESLGWAEVSIAPMRVPVFVASGHADARLDGYVIEEGEVGT